MTAHKEPSKSDTDRSTRTKGRGQGGVAIVEFAIVSGLLFMILFGIIEFGLAFRDRLTVSSSTQSAARVVASLGDNDDVDFQMLLSLEQSLSTLPNAGVNTVRYVDVFQADNTGNPIGDCASGDRCNRYIYKPDPLTTCDWAPCPDPSKGYSSWKWAPDTRDVALPDLDVVGVRVTFAHQWVTGGLIPLPKVQCRTIGASDCWADTALMRLEPQVFQP